MPSSSVFNPIYNFIFFPQPGVTLILIEIIFLIFSIFLLVSIIILFFVSSWGRLFLLEDATETFTARPYGAEQAFKEWSGAKNRLYSQRESDYKSAVIEADALLEEVLKRLGYAGDSVEDRLNQVDTGVMPNLDQVKRAHKIRNNVVYDPEYKISLETAKGMLEVYEKAFRDMEVF